MKIKTNAYYLTSDFFKDYPYEKYNEMERKIERPYCIATDENTGQQFAIPLRTNATHKNCYTFKNSSRKTPSRLDFSKAVLIKKNSYIGKKATMNMYEQKELMANKYKISSDFEQSVNIWKKNIRNGIEDSYSVLKYFKEELGVEKELTNELNINNKKEIAISDTISHNREIGSEKELGNMGVKETLAKEATIMATMYIADHKDEIKEKAIQFLKERFTKVKEKLEISKEKSFIMPDSAYTKKAYDELTNGESTKLLEKINQTKLELKNEPTDKLRSDLEKQSKELSTLVKQYPIEKVNEVENNFKNVDLEKMNQLNLENKQLVQENTMLKNLLENDPQKLEQIIDKALDERVQEKSTTEIVKDKTSELLDSAKGIAETIMSWEMSQTLKGKSTELEKSNDLER